MVNPGHPSKACSTCKIRKIKCDLARPTCGNCAKSERICLGYQDHQKKKDNARRSVAREKEKTPSMILCPISKDYNVMKRVRSSADAAMFLENYLFSQPLGPGLQRPRLGVSLPEGFNITKFTLHTIRKCFSSLREQFQTKDTRSELIEAYSLATTTVTRTVATPSYSLSLIGPIFFFALWEMSVYADMTRDWQIHLGGLIAMLVQVSGQLSSYDGGTSSLPKAWRIFQPDAELSRMVMAYEDDRLGQILFTLDVAKYRLCKLALEIEDLFNRPTGFPRKLDVQKVRVSIKKIQKNIDLFPNICPQIEKNDENSRGYILLRWCDYYTLQIIVADLLLKTGEFVNPRGEYLNSLEYRDAHATLRAASEGICDSVYEISKVGQHDLANASIPSGMSMPSVRALSVIWVIGCALKASASEGLDCGAAEGILQMISDQYRIPLAFGVVCHHPGPSYSSFLIMKLRNYSTNLKWSDILAGLLLVHLALTEEIICCISL